MTTSTKSVLLASVAVLSWSTVATAFKVALSYLSVFEMVLIANLTAVVIFTALMAAERQWHRLRSLPMRTVGLCALMGLLNPVAYYLILFSSYDYLPAQVAQPINYIWPIALLLLLSIFNKEPIPKRKYIGMIVSLAGLVLIALGGKNITGEISPLGISMAIISAILWAFYWMINDRIKNTLPESMSLFLGFLFGAIYMVIASVFVPVHVPSVNALLSGVYIGIFEMGVPFICFGLAIRTTHNPALINQMCYLAPFLSLFFISMVLREPIVTSTLLGLLLIVAGIVYNQYFAVPQKQKLKQSYGNR